MSTAIALKEITSEDCRDAAKLLIKGIEGSLNHRGKMVERDFFWDYQITNLRHREQEQSWSFIVNPEHLNFYFRTLDAKAAAPLYKLEKLFSRPQNKVHKNPKGEHIVRITDQQDAAAMIAILKLN